MLYPIIGVSVISSITSSGKVVKHIKDFVPKYNIQRRPKHYAGRNGILFEVLIDDKQHALKCYTQPFKNGEALCAYIKAHPSERLPLFTYYPQELLVPTFKGFEWIDVGLYPWTEGSTLDFEIKRCVHNHNTATLLRLAEEFKALSLDILNSPWRHGDLKPENIIVTPEGRMRLVDIDALWAPTLPPCNEVGTPNFIHPLRGANRDEYIDDYSIALLVVNIHALLHIPFPEVISKGLLFTASEALDGHPLYQQAVDVLGYNTALVELCHALADPTTYKIPNLKEIISNV